MWSPLYEVDIGPHVFPTRKYRLVRELLLREGWVEASRFVQPEAASWDDVALIHTPEYVGKIREDTLSPFDRIRLEVPFSPALREASILCCGGTVLTGRLALEHGQAVHLGGGFHHAFAAHGEGFCLLNDVAVAAAALLEDGTVARVLIVDLDVHHGNGTASIFASDPRVFTVSLHQERNYPSLKPPSDLDFGLPDGIGDEEYLAILRETLLRAVDRARPQVAFYLAGADPYREDQLGGLGLSLEGLRRRDAFVLGALSAREVPVAVVLAGGYAFRQSDTVAIHAATVAEALALKDAASRP